MAFSYLIRQKQDQGTPQATWVTKYRPNKHVAGFDQSVFSTLQLLVICNSM